LGIELIPADDWGEMAGPIDHTEIELREGLVRRIQRESEAADARTWGFSRSAIAGRGYWLVMTRYAPGKTSDQEVYIDRIYNQASVLLDPSHEQPDGSDAEWGFFGRDMLLDEFKGEFPDAKLNALVEQDSQWRSLCDEAPGWFKNEGKERSVRVMNYVYTERKSETLYHLTNGGAAYAEELVKTDGGRVLASDPSVTVVTDDKGKEQSHTETKRAITWCKITGNEVLEKTPWPGHWLPIIKTVGEELQPYDQERRCEGIVRPMRDSCKGNNYVISKFVERVGLTPIPPIIMAGGQDEGYEDEWNAANTRTLSRLHYNQKDTFGVPVAQPPFRADARAEIADIGAGVQIFGEAIQATSVMPETALGHVDPSVKSGKLAKALIEQGDRGTSNFMDNLVRSLRHEARVVNDLLYPIYGRPGRLARMMNGQGEMTSVVIGQPFVMQGGQGKQGRPQVLNVQPGQPLPQGAQLYELTEDANFNVAVKVTKTIETRRQQIAQFLGELISSSPEQMVVIGDKLWKYLDVPDHEEIEERYKVMLAPPIQQMLNNETPIPPEAMQKIAMLEQQLQELAPLADKNKSDLMKTQITEAAEQERTAAEIASKERIERWKIEAQLEIEMAKLGNARMMARAEQETQLLHAHSTAQLAAEERGAQAAQADLDRQAERDTQAADQAFQAGESAEDRALQADQSERDRQSQAEMAERKAAQSQLTPQ
jgi:hypothetical protein